MKMTTNNGHLNGQNMLSY